MMTAIASIAITIGMFLGAPYLVAYVGEGGERSEVRKAYLARGMGTLVLVGVGGMMGMIVAVIRARYGLASTARPRSVDRLATACSLVARIVFASLLLAVVAYAIAMCLVLSDKE